VLDFLQHAVVDRVQGRVGVDDLGVFVIVVVCDTVAGIVAVFRAIAATVSRQGPIVRPGTACLARVRRSVQHERIRALETLPWLFNTPVTQGAIAQNAFGLVDIVVCAVGAVAQTPAVDVLEARSTNKTIGVRLSFNQNRKNSEKKSKGSNGRASPRTRTRHTTRVACFTHGLGRVEVIRAHVVTGSIQVELVGHARYAVRLVGALQARLFAVSATAAFGYVLAETKICCCFRNDNFSAAKEDLLLIARFKATASD
jgi:hypothetical protein